MCYESAVPDYALTARRRINRVTPTRAEPNSRMDPGSGTAVMFPSTLNDVLLPPENTWSRVSE